MPRQATDNELNAVVGLQDFYSDRAVAHASFVVACIFGLFTLLALVQNLTNLISLAASAIERFRTHIQSRIIASGLVSSALSQVFSDNKIFLLRPMN